MILRKNRKRKFQKNRLHESLEQIKNPGRGWYRIYTYDLAQELPELYIACEEETLALLLIDIGAFKNERISESALVYLEKILEFFEKNEKKVILRPVYDTTGHGMEREPGTLQIVKEHMQQLGEVIERYAENILVVQGIMVGDWGEMHGSKFLSDKHLKELTKEYITAMNQSCYLAVRTPRQWKTAAESMDTHMRNCLVLFNDGIFGSETDLGTYASSDKRKQDLKWQYDSLGYGPVGGEAVADVRISGISPGQDIALDTMWDNGNMSFAEPVDLDKNSVMDDLRKMHVTYLNSMHDQKLLDQWKAQTMKWNGSMISVYDYIGLHLGYRFIVRDATWTAVEKTVPGGGLRKHFMGKKEKFLEVTVENSGFADLYDEAECIIYVKTSDGGSHICPETETESMIEITRPECDARTWKSGTTSKIKIPADILEPYIEPEQDIQNGIKIYLQLRRKRDGMNIRFANADADNGVLLGIFR
nr:DUF4874 domain-containing protein [uncultured Dorea sp.]